MVRVNNGTAVRRVDCGPGEDTIYINPRSERGGISNSQALRARRIRRCEHVIRQAAAAPPPTRGVKRYAGPSGALLEGTERNDNLLGGRGADTILGRGGDDVIWGNRLRRGATPGADTLIGGEGADTIFGSRGPFNRIEGGPGDDRLQGGPRANTIDAGDGADRVRLTGRGPNVVDAGPGDDEIRAYASGPASVNCGPGRDLVRINFNRQVTTTGCERVTKRYR